MLYGYIFQSLGESFLILPPLFPIMQGIEQFMGLLFEILVNIKQVSDRFFDVKEDNLEINPPEQLINVDISY